MLIFKKKRKILLLKRYEHHHLFLALSCTSQIWLMCFISLFSHVISLFSHVPVFTQLNTINIQEVKGIISQANVVLSTLSSSLTSPGRFYNHTISIVI